MAVSVVIPTLHEAATIAETVRRLLAEDPRPEVVVADGGSGDGTPAVAEAAGAIVVPSVRGRGRQLNRGAAAATGDVLVFLHADCRLEPGGLAAARRILADPRVAAAGFRQVIDGDSRWFPWIARAADARVRWLRTIYGDSGLAVRRETFRVVGGFPDVVLFEDVGISARLRRQGRFHLLRHRIHVSARRWESEGVVRATLRNWWILTRYLTGASPERLSRYYADSR